MADPDAIHLRLNATDTTAEFRICIDSFDVDEGKEARAFITCHKVRRCQDGHDFIAKLFEPIKDGDVGDFGTDTSDVEPQDAALLSLVDEGVDQDVVVRKPVL